MSRGSGRNNAYIKWDKRPEFIQQEAERQARENAPQLVKVILPENGPDAEAIIYREGRLGLKHQDLTPDEVAMMDGDTKAFFAALWSVEEVRWILLKRAKNAGW